jgi:hypothetical protein
MEPLPHPIVPPGAPSPAPTLTGPRRPGLQCPAPRTVDRCHHTRRPRRRDARTARPRAPQRRRHAHPRELAPQTPEARGRPAWEEGCTALSRPEPLCNTRPEALYPRGSGRPAAAPAVCSRGWHPAKARVADVWQWEWCCVARGDHCSQPPLVRDRAVVAPARDAVVELFSRGPHSPAN